MLWPELPYPDWRETKDTLHVYMQVMGKVRSTLSPVEPDWGHAPFYLTARGVTTSPIPHRNGVFDIDVDFIDHVVSVRSTDGRIERIQLEPRTVAEFHRVLLDLLDRAGFTVEISAGPSDVSNGIPFAEDGLHRSYEPEWANRFWRALVCVDTVLKEHRARFRGKTSPVQLWWGSLDLAYSRFSGRLADSEHRVDEHRVDEHRVDEHWVDEHWAAGFWAGDERFPHAAFYAYASPKQDGIEAAAVEPDGAFWSSELGEFLLPYDAVASSADPRGALLSFLESTYRAGAERGGWDAALEVDERA